MLLTTALTCFSVFSAVFCSRQVLMAQQLQEFCDALVQKHVDGKMNQESEHLIQRYTKAWSRDKTVSVLCWLQISGISDMNWRWVIKHDKNAARSCGWPRVAVRFMAATMPSVASWMPYAMPCCKRCNTTSTNSSDLMIPNSQQLDERNPERPGTCFSFCSLPHVFPLFAWLVDFMCFEKFCRW